MVDLVVSVYDIIMQLLQKGMKLCKKERLEQIMEETKLKSKSRPNGKMNYNRF